MEIGYIIIIIGIISTIFNRYNNIIVLISLEIILIGITYILIITSIKFDDLTGIIFSIYLYTIGAAESSFGLSLIILYSWPIQKQINNS